MGKNKEAKQAEPFKKNKGSLGGQSKKLSL
jgi:hypothetical protein